MKNKRKGQGLVEYALIFGLMALAAVFALTTMGEGVVRSLLTHVRDNVANAEQTIENSK